MSTSSVDMFGYVGMVPMMAMIGLPLGTARRAWRSVEPLPTYKMIDPALAMLSCCAQWSLYGGLVGNPVIALSNLLGVLSMLVCVTVYFLRTRQADRQRQRIVVGGTLALLAFLFFAETALVPLLSRVAVAGAIGLVTSLLQFGAPAILILEVWRTGDAASLPLWPIVGFTVSASWWLVYALLKPDAYLTLGNCFGVLMALAQLATHLRFRNRPGSVAAAVSPAALPPNI